MRSSEPREVIKIPTFFFNGMNDCGCLVTISVVMSVFQFKTTWMAKEETLIFLFICPKSDFVLCFFVLNGSLISFFFFLQ